MNAFEEIVAMLLHRQGYWAQTSYKVELTRQDKRRMGLPSSPRWEIDVLAYRPVGNRVLAVECKSLLNSSGVNFPAFSGQTQKRKDRYKLFTQPKIRKVVLARLAAQLHERKLARPNPKVRLCLAAGHIRKGDEQLIREHCDRNGWLLFAPGWFAEQFGTLAGSDYENDVATVAAKLAARAQHQ